MENLSDASKLPILGGDHILAKDNGSIQCLVEPFRGHLGRPAGYQGLEISVAYASPFSLGDLLCGG